VTELLSESAKGKLVVGRQSRLASENDESERFFKSFGCCGDDRCGWCGREENGAV